MAAALLVMTGHVTMVGIFRWAGPGGSYRTVQRFFSQALPWAVLFWVFFRQHIYRSDEAYLLAGDEVVATKAGNTLMAWTGSLPVSVVENGVTVK
jgi:putative transposase